MRGYSCYFYTKGYSSAPAGISSQIGSPQLIKGSSGIAHTTKVIETPREGWRPTCCLGDGATPAEGTHQANSTNYVVRYCF